MRARHVLIERNGVSETVSGPRRRAPVHLDARAGQEGVAAVVPTDRACLGMGKAAENRHLITHRFEHVQRFVEFEILAGLPGKPTPVGIFPGFALVRTKLHGDTKGEIDRTETKWRPVFLLLGLGKRLVNEIFLVGRALGLKKLTVKMTPDQKGARTTFERLGFQLEALLADYVVDHEGKLRDMLIMSLDSAGFSDVAHLTATATS